MVKGSAFFYLHCEIHLDVRVRCRSITSKAEVSQNPLRLPQLERRGAKIVDNLGKKRRTGAPFVTASNLLTFPSDEGLVLFSG